MKYFALIAVLLCLAAAVVRSDDMKLGSAYGGAAPAAPAPSGGYGGASIPAPPCPKNYLFSCQPSLQPAPCSQPAAGGYGGAGAYSENYPVYALQVPQYLHGYQTY
ncbi:vitelline membrane protein Vm34Ca-like [Lucilia cuprina]|uniref:vitelline membrane protein Vm34Ca-like n=1 Tax=Lucilia cuprina TaxID=7375 RepID=UPI001F0642C3|nr:vitelline membrane protein Vm34Ca-like [Lucilia cuprina]